jgi:hypothetical protein
MSMTITLTTNAEQEQWTDAFLKPDGLNLLG